MQQVAQLRDVVDAIRQRGAELVVIGNGSIEQARAFREEQALTFELYTDPSLESYRLSKLRHGVASTFSPRALGKGIKALRQGYRQKATLGSPWQQGGAFVIGAGGRLLYAYASRAAGDHPDPQELVQALDP